MTGKDNIENKLEQLSESITPDQDFVKKVMTQIESKPSPTARPASMPEIWRIIMKSRMTKLAAAALIVVAVLLGIHYLGNSTGITNTAFAEVTKQLRTAHTLTFTIAMRGEAFPEPFRLEMAYKDPGYFRTVTSGGVIGIVDYAQKKVLTINQPMKEFTEIDLSDSATGQLDVGLMIEKLTTLPDRADKELGKRKIDGRTLQGFRVTEDDGDKTVWIDSENGELVRIEADRERADGLSASYIMTDFQFNVALNDTLFSLTPPDGYRHVKRLHHAGLVGRVESGRNMNSILKACSKYVSDHNGQWPDSLQELTRYDLDKEVFINPRQPRREIGYVYLKPPASASDSRIVLYEAHDTWDDGITVGFVDYHVEFIREESDFKDRLRKDGQ